MNDKLANDILKLALARFPLGIERERALSNIEWLINFYNRNIESYFLGLTHRYTMAAIISNWQCKISPYGEYVIKREAVREYLLKNNYATVDQIYERKF